MLHRLLERVEHEMIQLSLHLSDARPNVRRACQTAAELDPEFTPQGLCSPNHNHVAAGSLAMLKARRHMGEILRILPGSSLVVAPGEKDLGEPSLKKGFEESFGGGGYSAAQRAALLQMAWDHVGSALDQREHVFELHANGGIPAWRGRLRRSFNRYNELANAVVQRIGMPMPEINLDAIRNAPLAQRRPVAAGALPPKAVK